jgi:hypothetical protein
MKKLLSLLTLTLTTLSSGCTLSIIQTDTHGTATDVVDSAATSDAEVDPDISIPVKPI